MRVSSEMYRPIPKVNDVENVSKYFRSPDIRRRGLSPFTKIGQLLHRPRKIEITDESETQTDLATAFVEFQRSHQPKVFPAGFFKEAASTTRVTSNTSRSKKSLVPSFVTNVQKPLRTAGVSLLAVATATVDWFRNIKLELGLTPVYKIGEKQNLYQRHQKAFSSSITAAILLSVFYLGFVGKSQPISYPVPTIPSRVASNTPPSNGTADDGQPQNTWLASGTTWSTSSQDERTGPPSAQQASTATPQSATTTVTTPSTTTPTIPVISPVIDVVTPPLENTGNTGGNSTTPPAVTTPASTDPGTVINVPIIDTPVTVTLPGLTVGL